jgi:ubiquitin-protein ligase
LLEHHIVLDAILIGEGSQNKDLLALVKASNGYAFAPETISQALELCELETLLSRHERPAISEQDWNKSLGGEQAMKTMLLKLGQRARFEHVGFGVAPPRREPSELASRSMNVARAIETHSSKDSPYAEGESGDGERESGGKESAGQGMTSAARQSLVKHLRFLAKNPHPAMDIFPSESNLAFWKVILTAPQEESCLYAKGTYMLYVQVTTMRIFFQNCMMHFCLSFCVCLFFSRARHTLTCKHTLTLAVSGRLPKPTSHSPLQDTGEEKDLKETGRIWSETDFSVFFSRYCTST